jgi:hypothetical protein
MPATYEFGLWVVLGAAAACLHLWLLRRAIPREPTAAAAQRVLAGYPLRLLIQLPLLYLAVRGGLPACGGLIVGSVAGRWLLCWRALRPTDAVRVQE